MAAAACSTTGTATLTNCTVSGNSAPIDAGIGNGGSLALTNCTVSGNSAVGTNIFNGAAPA